MAITIFVALLVIFFSMFVKVSYDTISCYWLIPRRIQQMMEKQGVTGPKPRFLIGNISDIASLVAKSSNRDMETISHDIVPRLLPHFVAWSKLYGKNFIFFNGTEPRMCIADTSLCKEFLTNKYSRITGRSWLQKQGSKHFIGRGLLMANGNDWYHQRQNVAPVFMKDRVKSYAVNMMECTKEVLESIENEIKERSKNEVEIGKYMSRLTADIISRTMFDSSYEKGKSIFHLLEVLQRLTAVSSRQLWIPGSQYFPSKYNKQIKSTKKEVEKLLMEIIESRKEEVRKGERSGNGNDLLGGMLDELEQKRQDEELKSDMELIIDECKTIFFAGHDTTSLSLTWTIMLLATNPSWQDKVREELNQVCSGSPPSADQLSKLTVLSMVINESLRLYPPVTIIPRMTLEDIKLGELHIPKGVLIWVPELAIHHNKQIWGEDVNEFKPERFATKGFIPGREFLPFSAGPRNCVGQTFALTEAKIVLSMLVSKFRFTISDKYRHAPTMVITIKPKYGVQIYLEILDSQKEFN